MDFERHAVPAVFGMVCETFADVFASPRPSARQSFAHLQLARGVMRLQRSVFGIGDEAGFDEHASSSPMPIPAVRTRSKTS